MNLSKILAVVSSFWVASCFAGSIIKAPESDTSGLIDAVVHILESCYGKRITPVGLAGNSTGTISRLIMWSRGSSPIILINGTPRIVNHFPSRPHQNQQKLQNFVVTASSSITLARTIREIKESIWWNHMATFLILDWPPSNHGCSNAFEILWTAWEMNILNAILMCLHWEKGRLIYTYNPYTNQAPEIWQMDQIYAGINDHPWTLFVRKYEDIKEVCNELDFEKTNDLGGYEIPVSVTNVSFSNNFKDSGRICGGEVEQSICDILFPTLNAIPVLLVQSSLESLGYVDKEGHANGMLGEVMSGLSDLALYPRYLTSAKNVPISYPYWVFDLRIGTQYRGYKSQLSKIVSVVDSKSRFGLCLVCLINILFFKYFLRQPMMIGYLSTLRLVCNSSIPKIPRELPPRIYFAALFLFVVTIQGVYQGKLASLLTKQEPLRNVNTKKDLVDLDYTIYGYKTYGVLFREPQFKERFIELDKASCSEYPLRNRRAACVTDVTMLIFEAAKYNMYMSTDSVTRSYGALPMRPDWPLERRVNTILKRSFESYCLQFLYCKITEKEFHVLKIRESEMQDERFRILILEELSFAFAILSIGLGFAIITFAMEIGIARSRPPCRTMFYVWNYCFRIVEPSFS